MKFSIIELTIYSPMTTLSGLIKSIKPTHIISYDLGGPETSSSYKQLHAKIQSIGPWSKPLESFYMIQSELTCSSILESIKTYLDSNDRVLVVNITSGAKSSYGLDDFALKVHPKTQPNIIAPSIGKTLLGVRPNVLRK